jgi:hypothetical protein
MEIQDDIYFGWIRDSSRLRWDEPSGSYWPGGGNPAINISRIGADPAFRAGRDAVRVPASKLGEKLANPMCGFLDEQLREL